MTIPLRTITIFAFSLLLAGNLRAKDIYESDIKEEQRIATFTISSANNDLEQASVAYSRSMNNLAWVYITDCGVKLDGIKGKLKGHEERIAKALNFLGFGLSSSSRQKLMDSFFKIKDNITSAYVKMNAVEKDVGAKLGVDVAWVRQMLSALKAACETTQDQAFCDAYQKAKAAIDRGDIVEVNNILNGVYGKLKAVQGADPSIDVPSSGPQVQPKAQSGGASSNVSQDQMDEIASVMEALQTACDNGNAAACEKLAMLKKLVDSRDFSGAAQLVGQIKNDPQMKAIVSGSSMGGGGGADNMSGMGGGKRSTQGSVPVIVDGEELVFVNGTAIKTVYAGKRLKKETVLKLKDMDAQPPYEVVSTRDWNFSIASTQKQSSATVYVVEFNIAEQGGRDEYTVSGWTVRSPDGSVFASGKDMPFQVNFTASGSYVVEVTGKTDLGSEFTIKSSIQISL
ncbi:MAG: hypothetical protein WC360_08685 [Opitutales bacterium]|jgi:hypothetical protein